MGDTWKDLAADWLISWLFAAYNVLLVDFLCCRFTMSNLVEEIYTYTHAGLPEIPWADVLHGNLAFSLACTRPAASIPGTMAPPSTFIIDVAVVGGGTGWIRVSDLSL
ncbi:hypothetical protein PMIN03_001098 [Paraphaeosphaeria minitans]